MIKYFEDRSAKAIEISALVKGWIFEWHMEDPAILGLAWHSIGLANSALARQTVESSQRTEIQERAVAAFKKSLSYTPDEIEVLFDLSLVLSEI